MMSGCTAYRKDPLYQSYTYPSALIQISSSNIIHKSEEMSFEPHMVASYALVKEKVDRVFCKY